MLARMDWLLRALGSASVVSRRTDLTCTTWRVFYRKRGGPDPSDRNSIGDVHCLVDRCAIGVPAKECGCLRRAD